MNPRIQVEHTVTEEVTDVDLVQAQMRIAFGQSLGELGLHQEDLRLRGAALQCRITTEDPADGFRPDTGKITTYRSPGGGGIRLDGGTIAPGTRISPHFDSMLVKMTCHGRDFAAAVARAKRGLAEFRIRGVSTNIPFLQAVLDDPDLRSRRPQHLVHRRAPRAGQGAAVQGPRHEDPQLARRRDREPAVRRRGRPHPSRAQASGDRPRRAGARRLPSAAARARPRGLRGGAARSRTRWPSPRPPSATPTSRCWPPGCAPRTCSPSRPYVARLTPATAVGGGLGRCHLRRGAALPRPKTPGTGWRRCARRCPTSAIQMLLRGRNTVGYTPYPTEVTDAFVREAAASGVDIFRIFDALNDVSPDDAGHRRGARHRDQRRRGGPVLHRRPARPGGRPVHPRLLPAAGRADRRAGAHILAIKDMAGLLRAGAAEKLVEALRDRFDLPIHVHTHDTAGGQLATLLAASRAGADAVDVASAPMSGTTSQPSASALVAALAHTERDTGLSLQAVSDLEPYWEAVRRVYKPFESGLPGRRPAGCTTTRSPAASCPTCASRRSRSAWPTSSRRSRTGTPRRTRILGRPPKVTPSSKAVGDLALATGRGGRRPGRLRAEPRQLRHPRLGDRLHGRRAGRPCRAAGRSRSAPRCWQAAPSGSGSTTAHRGRRRRARTRDSADPPGHAQPPALPRPDEALRADARDLRRPVGGRHRSTTSTGSSRAPTTSSRSSTRRAPLRRARGDRRGRRQGHAHRHGDRSTASCGRSSCATAASSVEAKPRRRPMPPSRGMSPRRSPVWSPCRSRRGRGRGGPDRSPPSRR